jgi:hypothetical protein
MDANAEVIMLPEGGTAKVASTRSCRPITLRFCRSQGAPGEIRTCGRVRFDSGVQSRRLASDWWAVAAQLAIRLSAS